ncbi:MAG: DNA polymerase III subunit gamma/tau [Actinomycetota bacterium]|nr:DNA polymerase III subunit gamma/tau [Actinomycetota bacterium]MDA3013097.1 DNA polymerase III subunit gamma/tau [Actinomycetota bacterium]
MQEALYRKYRPSKIDDLIGQDDAVKLIKQQIIKNNLSHAYLFSGPRGVGKTSLARIIAIELGCDPTFDISEIDAASHNKVDDIRELNENINFIASSPGKKRVIILDEVHMLSNAASNAFLKTLEEPPEHVIFILATTEPERVLETIKSRTTHIVFKKIDNKEITTTLSTIAKKENITLQNDVLELISNNSDGSLRDAINLFEQTFSTFGSKATTEDVYSILGRVSTENMLEIVNSMFEQDTSKALKVLKENYKKGLQPKDILSSITNLFRNIFYVKYLPNDENIFNLTKDELKLVNQLNESITAKQLARILDLLDDINQNIKNAPSQELKLELFVIKLIKPEFAFDVKSLSRRIDLLEGENIKINTQQPQTEALSVESKKVPESKKKEKTVKEEKNKSSLENFDVIWPIILKEAKTQLTPRKYSYLTLVKPEIEDNSLSFLIDESNEFLITELNKSQDIKEFVEVEIEKQLGIIVKIQIKAQKDLIKESQNQNSYQDNLENIFGIENRD